MNGLTHRNQVVETLRKKSNECLAVTATSSGTVFPGNMAMRETSTSVYEPTVSLSEQRMELDWATGASCPDLNG